MTTAGVSPALLGQSPLCRDLSAAQLVRQIGAIPRLVKYTLRQLNAVQAELNHLAATSSAGKVRSWYVDPVSGTVVVSVPSTFEPYR